MPYYFSLPNTVTSGSAFDIFYGDRVLSNFIEVVFIVFLISLFSDIATATGSCFRQPKKHRRDPTKCCHKENSYPTILQRQNPNTCISDPAIHASFLSLLHMSFKFGVAS